MEKKYNVVKTLDKHLVDAAHTLILWLPPVVVGFGSLLGIVAVIIAIGSEIIIGNLINALEFIVIGIILVYLFRGTVKVMDELKHLMDKEI